MSKENVFRTTSISSYQSTKAPSARNPLLGSTSPVSSTKKRSIKKLGMEIESNKAGEETLRDFHKNVESATILDIKMDSSTGNKRSLGGGIQCLFKSRKNKGKKVFIKEMGENETFEENKRMGTLVCLEDRVGLCQCRTENDPFHYYLVSPHKKEYLLKVYGVLIPTSSDSEHEVVRTYDNFSVYIELGTPRRVLGQVKYGYLGLGEPDQVGVAEEEICSKATTMAGRNLGFAIPTTVLNEFGHPIFIFKGESETDQNQNQPILVLTADGYANVVAEISTIFKNDGESETTGKKSRSATFTSSGSTSAKKINTNDVETIRINFLQQDVPFKEKCLVFGVAVIKLNQLTTKIQDEEKICCGGRSGGGSCNLM